MRIVCDENVRTAIGGILEQEGHDVVRVQDELDIGYDDEDIIEYGYDDDRRVLTNDEDFLGLEHNGVLFLDEQTASPREISVAIERVERHYDVDTLRGETAHIPDGWV